MSRCCWKRLLAAALRMLDDADAARARLAVKLKDLALAKRSRRREKDYRQPA